MRARPVAALVYWRFGALVPHGGDARAQALDRALQTAGYDVVHVPIPMASYGDGTERQEPPRLQRLKRSLFPLPFRRRSTVRQVRRRLEEVRPQLVVSCVPHVHRACLATAGPVDVWLDFFDSWGRMARQELRFTPLALKPTVAMQAALWRWRERRDLVAADLVTYAGNGDRQASRRADATWLPTPVLQLPDHAEPAATMSSGRPVAGLLANWVYWPNRDAWDHFCREWWPVLDRAGWEVVVAGLGSDSLAAPEGVRVLGQVEHLSEFYDRVSWCLVPVRRGGGIKVKAVEALLWGKRVLADEHVLDGLPERLHPCIDVFRPEVLPSLAGGQAPARGTDLDNFTLPWFTSAVQRLTARRDQ